jgi:methylated-DNA-[protein]-cysteine S-methyltransferase
VAVTCLSYAVQGWGKGELWLEDDRVVWHELPHPRRSGSTRTPRRASGRGEELVRRFRAYFSGERQDFDDVELQLEDWTPFQLDVLSALRRVPYGEVVSYSDLARLAGHPRAQRAAGTFCAKNRFGLIVPCHRVVGSTGPGSYGSLGPGYKQRLLALEGVTV